MTTRTITLREDDIATLLDAALVQLKTFEGWTSLLNCTPDEREQYQLKIMLLTSAREAVLAQVMS